MLGNFSVLNWLICKLTIADNKNTAFIFILINQNLEKEI